MRVINVIETVNNTIQGIESFGVFEEQLVGEVSSVAEEIFIKKAKENGFIGDGEDEEGIIEDGYWDDGSHYKVSIVWSYIDE